MRSVLLAILAGIVGGAIVGYGSMRLTLGHSRPPFATDEFPQGVQIEGETLAGPLGQQPTDDATALIKVIGERDYDFGEMASTATESHTFVLENYGSVPLKLEKGETSCKCTVSDLATDELAPGARVDVRLEWTPKGYERHFSQTAEIIARTTSGDEVRRITLHVEGRVVHGILPDPARYFFGPLPRTSAREHTVRVYNFLEDDLEIEKAEILQPDTAEFFSVQIEPLSREEVLAHEERARSGVSVRLQAKPGLPLGPIIQTIRLHTNSEQAKTIEIPVKGTVISDITVVAKDFNPIKQTLSLGVVDGTKGIEFPVILLVKGTHRDETKITRVEADPTDILKVDVGEPEKTSSGRAVRIPVTLSIPAGSRSINRLGAKRGQLVFHTTHPQVEEMTVYVSFAVEGSP